MTLDIATLNDHWEHVFNFTKSRMPGADHAAIEDITAATFERAILRADTFADQGDGPRPWLLTIARNLVVDAYRRERHRAAADLGVVDFVRATVDAGTDRQLDQIEVRAALGRLPSSQRALLLGHYRDGHPLIDATGVRLHKSTSSRRHQKALGNLRSAIESGRIDREVDVRAD